MARGTDRVVTGNSACDEGKVLKIGIIGPLAARQGARRNPGDRATVTPVTVGFRQQPILRRTSARLGLALPLAKLGIIAIAQIVETDASVLQLVG